MPVTLGYWKIRGVRSCPTINLHLFLNTQAHVMSSYRLTERYLGSTAHGQPATPSCALISGAGGSDCNSNRVQTSRMTLQRKYWRYHDGGRWHI